jgi:uncharacterized membrane protein YphA (DoxX/SURF4 family)
MEFVRLALQLVVALGLINVWLLRSGKATRYRGGEAKSIREEFAAYGLPSSVMWLVGTLKVAVAAALLVGIFLPALVVPAAALLVVLMTGAFLMHLKVKDPFAKSIPSLLMLGMALALVLI